MVTERSSDSEAQAEVQLPNGVTVSVSVQGAGSSEPAAQAGAAAAGLAVAKAMNALPREARPSEQVHGIVGTSPPMRELANLLDRIQGSSATVLVTGENGTGKELVARAVHKQSNRAKERFVATNCSAFNDNLLESELFGHKRGSFTGAVSDKPGLFEVADKGTFFLDEVGDMSPTLQVKLLRVLQESVFMPVGGTETKKVDVRIIAATNRDLNAMVADGSFREDLFYRLHVVLLRVPPLRERKEDIPLLVAHFMARLAERDGKDKTVSASVMERLAAHHWPGNVRELENEIERVWVLSGEEPVIGEEHLTPSIRNGAARPAINGSHASIPLETTAELEMSKLPEAVEQLERRMIGAVLKRSGGNKTKASETLGISRRNLIRKVQAYGLDGEGAQGKGGK